MNGIKIQTILETAYPLYLAEAWDNVGLQIGTMNKEISSVLISLDLTQEVIEEAISKNSNLIIVHHPLIFGNINSIKTDSLLGNMIGLLIKNDITLYVAHTNFDNAEEGTNYALANLIKDKNVVRIEKLDFEQDEPSTGRILVFESPVMLEQYIHHIKKTLHLEALKLIGNIEGMITRVAVIGGSGSSFINLSSTRNVDLLITGDVTYHHALNAKALGINILDVGHNIEKNALHLVVDLLKSNEVDVDIFISDIDTNPTQNV